MIKRVIAISSRAYCHYRRKQLVVEREDEPPATVPLEDIGILLLESQETTISNALLQVCACENIAVLFCDEKHLPVGLLQPLSGNTLHTRVLSTQVSASLPSRKTLWKQIVQAKIKAQASVLEWTGKDASFLYEMPGKVKSGDPDNLEGFAARVYFPSLFGPEFTRDREMEGINSYLNYGYAIIRATIARAVSGAGLHPALGIHHHNQYDPYCLADDLMEPFRPLVDWKIWEMHEDGQVKKLLSRETKQKILQLVVHPCDAPQGDSPLFSVATYYAASLRECLAGKEKTLFIPRFKKDK